MNNGFVLLPVIFLFSVFVVLMYVTQKVEKREKVRAKQDHLSSMKSAIGKIRDQIETLKELYLDIEGSSPIEGENLLRYTDQGIIRDKSREYFFAIDTPAKQTTDKDGHKMFYVDRDTKIEVKGVVKDYSIRIISLYMGEVLEVVYCSVTNQFLGTHKVKRIDFPIK